MLYGLARGLHILLGRYWHTVWDDKMKQSEAKEKLRTMLSAGDTVYTRVDNVARSGMSRRISLFVIRDNEPLNITYLAAHAMGDGAKYDRSRYYGIRVDGCGMDMCFHIVYCLGRALFPDGFKVEGCGRNGEMSGWDEDGGYALKNREF